MKIILLLSVGLIISSCSTSQGFNRASLKNKLSEKTEMPASEINQAQSSKAKLPKPYKVGIYFQEPEKTESERMEWSWTDADKKKILNAVEKFKTNGSISGAFILSPSLVTGTDVKSLRQAAKKQGANALLVISGINDLDHYNNDLGWTYALVLPTLFVPATVSDVLFLTRAVMWDVNYDFSYLTAEAECLINRKYPAVFRTDKKQNQEAKEEAMSGLQNELVKRINNVNSKRD